MVEHVGSKTDSAMTNCVIICMLLHEIVLQLCIAMPEWHSSYVTCALHPQYLKLRGRNLCFETYLCVTMKEVMKGVTYQIAK